MSDQGLQFVLVMWKALCKILKINAKLSTVFYPEINSQSEIANQKMKMRLRAYVNHYQNDWVNLLPIAKFATNANPSASTNISPFQAIHRYVSRMSFDPVDLSKKLTCKWLANSKAWSIAANMERV